MMKRLQTMLFMSVLASAVIFVAVPVFAADEDAPAWYETFNGHEMWTTSLDDGLARSAQEGKPMLIDLFSPG